MGIFKAYDIRGIYGSELDEDMALRIGRAYAALLAKEARLKHRAVVVGRDMRVSSPSIQNAVIEGILSGGVDVIDIGLCSTPMSYFAVGTQPCDGGLVVTASHNPGQYTGFKLCFEQAKPIAKDPDNDDVGIGFLEKTALAGPQAGPERGERREVSVLAAYTQHVLQFAGELPAFKVGIDCANGMAGLTVPPLLDCWPTLRAHRLYFELDGSFPNHEANPLKLENMRDISALVRGEGLDLGAAFDGDADRVAFVDERGEVIPNDIMTALMAREFLRDRRGSAFVYDLRSSWSVQQVIKQAGGRPIRERVGHSFIKGTMRREDAHFGGELSGHYYFRDNYFADSAEIAFAFALRILAQAGRPLSEIIAELPRYHATGEINFTVPDPRATLKTIEEHFRGDGEIDHKDGVTISFGKLGDPSWWWFNLRPSNTEPFVRLNLEASSRELMEEGKNKLIRQLGSPE